MVTLIYMFLAFAVSVGAGTLGALLGLGGGVFLVPILIFLLGVPTHMAIGASIVAVIATSSAAAATYVRDELTNMRLGMFLELATTVGAITGAFTAHLVSESVLQVVFGVVLLYASYVMFHERLIERDWYPALNDFLASRLKLNEKYHDDVERRDVSYGVTRTPTIFGISYLAGVISGLLGIGGGAVKVPAMNSVGRVPIKVAVATSNFMIGVTAAASAVVYFNHQNIHAFTTAPVVLGILIGASLGARLTNRIESITLKKMFVVVLLILAAKLILTGLGVTL